VVGKSFDPEGPETTVVIATYNQHRWLELLLAGLEAQTDPNFGVIVADDGSDPPAASVVDRIRASLPFPIQVVAQHDQGFRKARIQNVAAASTDADLLVFLDGDCIPFRNLVEVYRSHARPGGFMTGAVSYLEKGLTDRITPKGVRLGLHEQAVGSWEALRIRGVHWKNVWHIGRKQTRPRIKGGNFAVAAELFRRVDGFDEVYLGYGKEDSDLRNRMRNAGSWGKSLWHKARVCHLFWDHPFGANRERPDPELYGDGRDRVRARIGLSTHRPGEET
jgi:glycosyltransferase involved in cell wall biosynthesis